MFLFNLEVSQNLEDLGIIENMLLIFFEFEQDIMDLNGVLIIPKGQEVTWSLLQGLKNFSHQVGIQEPILVRVKQDRA